MLGTIYPFFNLLSQRHQQLHSQAQFGQQRVLDFFGAGWGWLCLTPGQLLVSSHRSPEPSCYQTLPHEPVIHIITQKQKQNFFQVIKSNIMITAHTDSWLYTQVKNSMTMAQWNPLCISLFQDITWLKSSPSPDTWIARHPQHFTKMGTAVTEYLCGISWWEQNFIPWEQLLHQNKLIILYFYVLNSQENGKPVAKNKWKIPIAQYPKIRVSQG